MFVAWSTNPVRKGWGTRAGSDGRGDSLRGTKQQFQCPWWGELPRSQSRALHSTTCLEGERQQQREVQTAYKEKFPPTPRTETHWNGAQRGCVVSSLGGFQETTGLSPAQPSPTSQSVWLWAGGHTRDLSFHDFLWHRKRSIWCLSQGDFTSPMLVLVSFPSSAKRVSFSLKPRNPL